MPHPAFSLRPARLAAALLTLTAAGLTACGGGGGGGDAGAAAVPVVDAGMPAQANARLNQSAAGATALVREVEQRTRDLQLAGGLAGATTPVVPAGVSSLPTIGLRSLPRSGRKTALAVVPITSELCSSGTASIDVPDALLARFDNPNATLLTGDRLSFTTSACVVKAAVELGTDLALGNFGVGATISGTFVLEVVQRSGTDQVLKLTYTGFEWKPVDGVAFPALDAVITVGTQGGAAVFSLDLPGRRFLDTPAVSNLNGAITVTRGSLRSAVPATAGSGYADIAYTGWRYQTATGHADAGSASLQGADGVRAVVTAVSGGYSVQITSGGASQTYAIGN
jgi:hypothetical protein